MKAALLLCLVFFCQYTRGYLDPDRNRDAPNGNNVFIITLDGFRWQEVFNGADSALLNDPQFTNNIAALKQQFWHPDVQERRKRLMPFVWSTIASQGQLFGNRTYHNRVDVSNIYRLSYPGYNEIFTGKPDLKIFSNDRKVNRNRTLLEHLNATPAYAGKVAAFASWNLFSYILNEKRSKFYINCNPDKINGQGAKLLASKTYPRFYDEGKNTRNDWLTFAKAQQYIMQHLPKVVYVGLGGTDEYAHQKNYGHYLQQAHQADQIIAALWQVVQSIPFYKNNTTFVITTDHGRGEKKSTWHKHGFLTKGSSQTWLALLGNGIAALGEHKRKGQLYQRQLAGTIASLLGVPSFRNEAIPASFYMVAGR